MTQAPVGGPAATVYQVASRKGVVGRDAQRVIVVTDGRPAEGGPQQAAYFVTDAEIAAGEFVVTGNKPLPIVLVGAQGAEYPPVAYYNVTGKPNDYQPPQNAPVTPSDPIGDALRADAVAYWKMDESSGTRIDATGRGNDLTDYSNNVASGSGKINADAIIDDETLTSYKALIHARNADLGIFGNTYYYFFGWIKLTALGDFSIIELENYNDLFEAALNVFNSGGYFRWNVGDFGGCNAVVSLELNRWYFIEAYYDSITDSVGVAVDNSAFSTDTPTSLSSAADTPYFSFGLGFADSDPVPSNSHFSIDEVGVLHRLPDDLSPSGSERSYLYNSGAGRALFPAP